MDEKVKVWPGRKKGHEGEWREAIRNWDEKFHQWMQGKIDDDEAFFAYEEFNGVLSDHYLENELTAPPEFPRYGTKHLRDEEQYCSIRGIFMQSAIEIIDNEQLPNADDLTTFRNAIYHRAIKKYWDSDTWVSGFVDVDYTQLAVPTSHLSPG